MNTSLEPTRTAEHPDISVLSERVTGLRELIVLHDKLTKERIDLYNSLTKDAFSEHFRLMQLAIDKAYSSLDTRLMSMNEFRQQQKDVIATFASQKTLDDYVKSSTERFEANVKNTNDKIYALEKQLEDKLLNNIKIVIDKFEQINKNSDMKLDAISKLLESRFTDLQKEYIRPLADWKNNMQGRGFVLLLIWPIIVALIGFVITHLTK